MLTPYTAWTIQYDSEGEYTGDFFNVEDYDRIKQNIEYLREYAYFLYGGFTMRGMVAVTVESYGYASTIDALDANLEAIAANTFRPPDMLPVKQWRGNQPPPCLLYTSPKQPRRRNVRGSVLLPQQSGQKQKRLRPLNAPQRRKNGRRRRPQGRARSSGRKPQRASEACSKPLAAP